uniref:ECM11 domain-containing protein n=1 Tax=Strongyloides venezuelensis TaxID=75913 RepID=A0A0K0F636_STRVS
MSNYQHKPSGYHLAHTVNKGSWPGSSVSCNMYSDNGSNKPSSTKNNVVNPTVTPQFSHNYNDYTRNNSYDNQAGSYMTAPGYYYDYSKRGDNLLTKSFIPNDKRHNGIDINGSNPSNSKKPRVEDASPSRRVDDSNGYESKGLIAPQVASAISSYNKNKNRSYLLSSGLKNYIRKQNDIVSRNASETYSSNSHQIPDLFVNQGYDLPLSPSINNIFSNGRSNTNDGEESSSNDVRASYNSSELQNTTTAIGTTSDSSKNGTSNGINNVTTTNIGEENSSNSCHLSEFLKSDFWKEITSENFMVMTKEMYKNFVLQFRPIVNDLVDKAKSTKKEDRDNLAMDMWQLGCLENTIRNRVEKIDVVEAKMFSLIQSLETRKFILNSVEKAIQEGKNRVYKAAEK